MTIVWPEATVMKQIKDLKREAHLLEGAGQVTPREENVSTSHGTTGQEEFTSLGSFR